MNKAELCITKPVRMFMKSKNTKKDNNTSFIHNLTLNQSSNSSNYFNFMEATALIKLSFFSKIKFFSANYLR